VVNFPKIYGFGVFLEKIVVYLLAYTFQTAKIAKSL